MFDALPGVNLRLSGSITTALGSVGTLSAGASEVGAAEIATEAVTFNKHKIIGTGSPPVFALTELVGRDALPTAGSKWIVFGNTFGTQPYLSITPLEIGPNQTNATNLLITGSLLGTGSFLACGSASLNTGSFGWFAIGSGQV